MSAVPLTLLVIVTTVLPLLVYAVAVKLMMRDSGVSP